MDVNVIVSLLAGVAAGFIGAVTSGGGLISIPILIFLGLPANVAIATNRLGAFGVMAAAIPRYSKAKKIRWDIAWKFIPLAILGGFIGSKALVHINTDTLSIIVGVLLLLMVPLSFIGSEKGIKPSSTNVKKMIAGYFLYFLAMLYGGFFGAGGGMFVIYTFVYFFGTTYIEANGTSFIPWFLLSTTALIVFLTEGLVNFHLGIPLLAGMYLGGTFGAKTALEQGNFWVRGILVVVLAASAVKLLFFR